MTNYDAFSKPIIHFGNTHEHRPVEPTPENVEEKSK
jgi:hypothetical protein